MAHREYKNAGVDMTADVFDMGGPLQAFGMYSAERSPEYHFIPIGAEGYSSESTLNFLQGRYYVRLAAFGDGAAPALENFARAISQSIGGDRSLPGLLDMLPRENRVARSEKYVVQAPAGHDFLAPALTASYRFDGEVTTLVISLAADAREANQRVEQLRQYYSRSGGEVIFFARGRLAVLCLHAPGGRGRFSGQGEAVMELGRRQFLALLAPALLPAAAPALSIAHYKSSPAAPDGIAEEARRLTRGAIEALGGMGRFVSKGHVVWVKPNIAWDRRPEQAACTNPDVVAALVEMCFQAGAKKVAVGDNPCNSPQRTFPRSGIQSAARRPARSAISWTNASSARWLSRARGSSRSGKSIGMWWRPTASSTSASSSSTA